jgi:tartrate-resistant acid phosphatase type 5
VSKCDVAVIGDWGEAGWGQQVVGDLVRGWRVDAVVTTGDNNYGGREAFDQNCKQQYGDFMARGKFHPCVGNHDVANAEGSLPFLEGFGLESTMYRRVVGPVEFFFLDSNVHDSVQERWLMLALCGSKSPWKVVVCHHPPYSTGDYGDHEYMQLPYHEWGANLVLSGHEHFYERLLINKTHYFINGLGGHSFRTLPATRRSESQARFSGQFGAMRIMAEDHKLAASFVDVSQCVMDMLVLTKPVESGDPLFVED